MKQIYNGVRNSRTCRTQRSIILVYNIIAMRKPLTIPHNSSPESEWSNRGSLGDGRSQF